MYINECVYTYTSNFQEGRELVLAAFLKEPVVIFEPLKNEFRKQKAVSALKINSIRQ